MSGGFPSLMGGQDDLEEGFWSSFSNVMMVILKIFLLVIIVMALNNRKLLDDLENSVQAQAVAQQEAELAATKAKQSAAEAQKSAQVVEFQLKANATLEEQLDYLQQRSASLEMELLRSRAETEATRNASTDKDAELTRLQTLSREQADTLGLRDKAIVELQTNLDAKNAQAVGLQTKVDESEKKLLSLQGEFTELDQKYQKLLKPARSAKGKQVVEVVYSKNGYSIRKPGETAARSVNRSALDSELSALKTQYNADLYVKVIIPDNSSLSYNEAWRFTSEMLKKYDYYSEP
ncbi:MAG: hypothetical protein BWK73_33420 [Thiothrix lacustris]|uniref:Uncharacterized protein n=1 Tax=Thiothrix lacustris TaxID=525917 RepID=A0A1Y1QH46_9GAMM|nr:MAG: hypothetical protein BWK73_33420 [Thiothrix lacustris]